MTTQAQPGQKQETVTLLTPEFRLSYPYLFDPQKQQRADGKTFDKYSCVMIFRVKPTPESEAKGEKIVDIKPLRTMALTAVQSKWGLDQSKWDKKLFVEHPNGNSPFRDGGLKNTDGYGPGTIYVTAWSTFKPQVFDRAKNEVLDKNLFYPGCYARAVISMFSWYNKQKGNGVSFNLHGIQFVRDGNPLTARVDASKEFDAIETPAVAAAAGAPNAQAAAEADPFGGA